MLVRQVLSNARSQLVALIRAAAISIAGLLSVGCRIVDGYYPESTYQLHIVTERDASYSVRLSTDTSNGAILPSDGKIDVNVPQQLWGQKRLGRIPVSRANPRPNIEILDEGCVVRQLQLSTIDKLPHDVAGYVLVKLD